jgi:hypothetical protein
MEYDQKLSEYIMRECSTLDLQVFIRKRAHTIDDVGRAVKCHFAI